VKKEKPNTGNDEPPVKNGQPRENQLGYHNPGNIEQPRKTEKNLFRRMTNAIRRGRSTSTSEKQKAKQTFKSKKLAQRRIKTKNVN